MHWFTVPRRDFPKAAKRAINATRTWNSLGSASLFPSYEIVEFVKVKRWQEVAAVCIAKRRYIKSIHKVR